MLPKGWIRLDSQEALDAFRREHYLRVYTAALELTNSPAQAHELATLVFAHVAQRFASKPIAKDCDLYLTAQVNLLFAQGALNAPFHAEAVPGATTAVGAASPPSPDSQSQGAQPQPSPASPDANPMRAVTSAMPSLSVPTAPTAPQSPSGAPMAVYSSFPPLSQATSPPSAPTAQAAPQAPPFYQTTVPSQATQPVQAAVSQPVEAFRPVTPLQVAPFAPSGSDPQSPPPAQTVAPLQAVVISQAAAPTQAEVISQETAPPQAAPAAADDKAPKAAPVFEAVYNPQDTDFWVPEGVSFEVNEPTAEEPPAQTLWDEEENEKPSVFLSILNGVLTLGGIGSAVYLLLQLNLFPRFF